ncbi:MAG: hypothetical protein EAX95_02065 [Candidatus Thorarchaeota archaeon]|nr:hypothetical protein [Candidatus Thorarchaeota archaeon]
MRIHDLLLETDLTRHDPNNPTYPPPSGDPENGTVFDGTDKGAAESDTETQKDLRVHDAEEELLVYWTGPWPWLHFERPESLASYGSSFHVKRDLLDTTSVVYASSMDWGPAETETFWEEILEEAVRLITFGLIMAAALVVFRFIEQSCGTAVGLMHGAVGLWATAIAFLWVAVDTWVQNGKNLGWAASVYAIAALGMLGTAWGGGLVRVMAASVFGFFSPALGTFLWNALEPLVMTSILPRLVLTITGILLLIFMGLTYAGILHG